MRYFLKLAYNGLPFHGWQRQPNAASVQQVIEESLRTIFQKEIPVTGAGRTDTGVHAREMYAHFDIEDEIKDKNRFLLSLNRMAGRDISFYDVIPVTDDAHARFDATGRTYRYYITDREDPFLYNFTHLIKEPLDVEEMNRAAAKLLEVSDFTSFAKLHTDTKTNICDVREARWEKDKNTGLLVFTISADRFLRNMVRAVVGTLIMVGRKKITLEEFDDIIKSRNRCNAGNSMPPQALFLEKIDYPDSIFRPYGCQIKD